MCNDRECFFEVIGVRNELGPMKLSNIRLGLQGKKTTEIGDLAPFI